MFTFLVQSLDWITNGQLYLFVIFFLWVWFIWCSKAIPALFYKPFKQPHSTTTSVIIPVVDEPEELFRDVLRRIVAQDPTEVIVVVNGKYNASIERICREFRPMVQCLWTPERGKRNALRIGIERASGEVAVLVDSDTLWTDNTLAELLKPFADPRTGGATTHQKILKPDRNLMTRFADWMEDLRSRFAMPAQSVFGQVGCLPGRTIAFRTAILRRALPDFLTESFLGVHIEVSDDRSLTNYALKYGYRTVYQRTSVVYTDAPTSLGRFVRQQYRWSKGSQYNTLKMWRWMLTRTPLLWLHFTADIITPFFLVGVFTNMVMKIATHSPGPAIIAGTPLANIWVQLGLAVMGAVISIGIRQVPHFRNAPKDVWLLPLFVVVLTIMMTPIRIWGFMTCATDSGWGTRPNAYSGGNDEPAEQRTPMSPITAFALSDDALAKRPKVRTSQGTAGA